MTPRHGDILAAASLLVGSLLCWNAGSPGAFMCLMVIGGVYARRTTEAAWFAGSEAGLRRDVMEANSRDRLNNGGVPTEAAVERMGRMHIHTERANEWARTK